MHLRPPEHGFRSGPAELDEFAGTVYFVHAADISRNLDDDVGGGAVAPAGGALALTTTVRSVRSRRVGAIGIGLTRPPSTSCRPSIVWGVKMVGIAIEARIASNRGPRDNQTSFPFWISVATAVKGTGRSSMLRSPINSMSTSITRSPLNSPVLPKERSSRRITSRRRRARTQRVNTSSLPAA